MEDLNGIFHEQLKNFFFSSKEIAGYLNQADRVIKEKEDLLVTLDLDQKKIKGKMDKLYTLYLAGEIPKEGFGERYRPLEARLNQFKDQIPEIQGELDFLKIQYLSSDQVINDARDLYSRWPYLIHDEKRKVVENITENILIGKDDIAINLCYLPSSSELMAKSQHNLTDSSLPPA